MDVTEKSTAAEISSPAHQVASPIEVRRLEHGRALLLTWRDGLKTELSAPVLRNNSQSAGAKRLKLRGLHVPAHANIAITEVRPIGHYALNLIFSDGHDRGIYPWAFLRELAERQSDPSRPANSRCRPSIEDFLIGN